MTWVPKLSIVKKQNVPSNLTLTSNAVFDGGRSIIIDFYLVKKCQSMEAGWGEEYRDILDRMYAREHKFRGYDWFRPMLVLIYPPFLLSLRNASSVGLLREGNFQKHQVIIIGLLT